MTELPLRVYVDTCVLSAVAKSELPSVEHTAWDQIAGMVQSSAVTLFSSRVALEEIGVIPPAHRGPHIVQYDAVAKVSSDITYEEYNSAIEMPEEAEEPLFSELRDSLPDENDARHLAHAKLDGIAHVLTLDGKTILKYRTRLRDRFGILVFRPSEFVSSFSSVRG